ncbi:hypothetical protein NPIL_70751, partial [Nephila pilipes]
FHPGDTVSLDKVGSLLEE